MTMVWEIKRGVKKRQKGAHRDAQLFKSCFIERACTLCWPRRATAGTVNARGKLLSLKCSARSTTVEVCGLADGNAMLSLSLSLSLQLLLLFLSQFYPLGARSCKGVYENIPTWMVEWADLMDTALCAIMMHSTVGVIRMRRRRRFASSSPAHY